MAKKNRTENMQERLLRFVVQYTGNMAHPERDNLLFDTKERAALIADLKGVLRLKFAAVPPVVLAEDGLAGRVAEVVARHSYAELSPEDPHVTRFTQGLLAALSEVKPDREPPPPKLPKNQEQEPRDWRQFGEDQQKTRLTPSNGKIL